MGRVALKRVGEVDIVSVEAISKSYGRDFIPHPFQSVQKHSFATSDAYFAYVSSQLDQVKHGDLRPIGQWFRSYVNADIYVACTVDAIGQSRARLLAHRSGEVGYLAKQDLECDVIHVYTLSPFDLGAAIAGSVQLTKPGRCPNIVIPEIGRQPEWLDQRETDEVIVKNRKLAKDCVEVPYAELAVFARVQSRWQPARDWGFDRTKKGLVWVRPGDDGEYIYAPGFSHLTPMDVSSLRDRIDMHIAEDIVAVRASR